MQGKTISHFEILDPLGTGGMGVVYKARDLTLHRAVALKFLPFSLAHDEKDRRRFLREARAASRLSHPNICTIHEIGEDADGQLFLCMELCEGETLRARLERGPLPLDEALEIAIQIAAGLGQAHEAGIVHRDIKPANIVVDARSRVKILDFGLALIAGETRLTRVGSAVGTVAYMSPEQVRGGEIDQRSDLWSLGALLFEMLTGRLPFDGASEPAILNAVMMLEPQPLAAARPGLPQALDRLLGRLLAKDPASRIASAAALEQELRRIRQGIDSQEKTRTFAAPLPRIGKRRLRLASGSFLGFAALSVLVFATRGLWRSEPPRRIQNLAVLPFTFTGDPTRDYVGEGLSSALISQLSGVPGLNVVSSAEASSYKESRKGTRQIAKELGAQEALEGQVEERGERVRVEATLRDCETGSVLWSSRPFEGGRREIFSLQNRLAREVVEALDLPLSEAERRRLTREPANPLAYDFYLRARSLLDDVDHPEDLDSAAELFRDALELDPSFALAHAGLSEALVQGYAHDKDSVLLGEARREAKRALELDPTLPDAHIALATVDRKTGRIQQSIQELRRLVALHPKSDAALWELAVSYDVAHDPSKAERTLRQAIVIRPNYWSYWNQLGSILQEQGDYSGARQAYGKAVQTAPSEFSWPRQNLAGMETQLGNFAAAIAIFERIPRPILDPILAGNIGTAYFLAGRLDEAAEYFQLAVRLEPRNAMWHSNLADLLLHKRDAEAARAEYRTAAQLFENDLKIDPGQKVLQLRRAVCVAKAGECGEALPLVRQLEADLPPNASNSWRIAQAYAACAQRAPAVTAIRRAVEKGYPAAGLLQQDEFKPLLNDPALASILAAARAPSRKD